MSALKQNLKDAINDLLGIDDVDNGELKLKSLRQNDALQSIVRVAFQRMQ